MRTWYLHYIHHPTPFLHIIPLPLIPILLDRSFSVFLLSDFVEGKKWLFCLQQLYTEFLCNISMYIYVVSCSNDNLVCPLRFSRNLGMQFWKCHIWVWNRIEHFIIHLWYWTDSHYILFQPALKITLRI
jgi:hypothetical protein